MHTAMTPLMSLCISLLFLLSSSHAASHGTCKSVADIELTCRTATESRSIMDYDFCVSALTSHPHARSTDLHGLAVAATRLAIDHAASTEAKIEELMDLEEEAHVRDTFGACLEVYSDATDTLRDALDNMNAKLYQKASGQMMVALDAHGHCEKVFMKVSAPSPLVKEDRDYGRLADIAMAIAASVE